MHRAAAFLEGFGSPVQLSLRLSLSSRFGCTTTVHEANSTNRGCHDVCALGMCAWKRASVVCGLERSFYSESRAATICQAGQLKVTRLMTNMAAGVGSGCVLVH